MTQPLSARELLEERARVLAQPPPALELDTSHNRLLRFRRGAGHYALDTRHVLEVVAISAHTLLPLVPSHSLGLTSARGELLPLFDLGPLLGETAKSEAPRLMLLCGTLRAELAIAIDEALELVPPGTLLPPPADASSLIEGVSTEGFTVLDGTQLLSDPRLTIDSANQENLP